VPFDFASIIDDEHIAGAPAGRSVESMSVMPTIVNPAYAHLFDGIFDASQHTNGCR
jgi:hypothetical protein